MSNPEVYHDLDIRICLFEIKLESNKKDQLGYTSYFWHRTPIDLFRIVPLKGSSIKFAPLKFTTKGVCGDFQVVIGVRKGRKWS